MKKILLYVILCVLFCSCKSLWNLAKTIDYGLTLIRMNKKTELTYHYGEKKSFIYDKKSIFIPCKINDSTHLLLYDSGLSEELLKVYPGNVKLPKTRKTMKQTIETASKNGVVVKRGLKHYNIESDLFNFKKIVGYVMSVSSDTIFLKCTNIADKKYGFILGWYSFPKRENTMLLNFSDTTITLLNSGDIYDTTDFMYVKSKLDGNGIYIYLMVDSIEYEFNFDTGSNGFLSLSQNGKHKKIWYDEDGHTKWDYFYMEYENHKKENDTAMVGITSIDASGIVVDTVIFQQTNTITMGDLDSIKGKISYEKTTTYPRAGMQFISNFDWIIDRSGKKVYAKQIKKIEYKNISPNYYRVDAFDSTLQISLLPVGETEYELFSIVDSVNGEKVNAENICQMRELLNKENGFKNNKIVVLTPKK